ncbi:MAG: phospho-sugar mutase, partial [Clostridia bacterium]|nr:phospho-sugar mutase [Clostridia bacterium]
TEEKITLPKSDVLLFVTDCGDKIFVRPSGTEPKVKLYYLANDKTKEAVDAKIAAYTDDMTALMN